MFAEMIPLLEQHGLLEPPEGSLPSDLDVLRLMFGYNNDNVMGIAQEMASWCKLVAKTKVVACQVIKMNLKISVKYLSKLIIQT